MLDGRARIDYCPSLFAHRAAGRGLDSRPPVLVRRLVKEC